MNEGVWKKEDNGIRAGQVWSLDKGKRSTYILDMAA